MDKTFALAEVKAVDTKEPNGEFEAILSAPTLDRDGEVIDKGAFNPLPDTIPVHAFHDFHDPIGRAQPFYDGDLLKVRGIFASTPRAQEIRTLVTEGVITNMSVGFMSAERDTVEKVPHITRAEILEGSFVSIPSNREAAVLVAKAHEAKAADLDAIQAVHDLLHSFGAKCAADVQVVNVFNVDDEKSTDPADEAAAPAAADLPADVVRTRARRARALLLLNE